MSAFTRALSKSKSKKSRSHGVDLNGLFTLDDDAKKPSKDEEKKINELAQYLSTTAQKDIPHARIEYVVRNKGTEGDFHKSFELIELFQGTVGGLLKSSKPGVKMLGAVNRDKVTCYLDALLFAMFAKTDVFEAILFNNFEDEPRKRLVIIIRLWVNLLRTGRLVTTDITQQLQDALADCGWEDAAQLRQQDVSEAFGFITDQLKLPLLTLKSDIYHAGKEEANDDHKFITERLLDVAIPEEVQNDAVVTLEACLEDYFNNRVEVKRELQRRRTRENGMTRSDSMEKVNTVHVETTEVEDAPETPTKVDSVIDTTPPKRPDFLRTRAPSIFSQRKVYLDGKDKSDDAQTGRPRGASIKKEVQMPAWQFINLIPWYTDAPGTATDDERQAQAHFSSKRPMLGICLKRYKVSNNGNASRLNTRVDIPLEMSTPYFAIDDTRDGEDISAAKFKLVLQSVVCHRGHSVNSGHYISLVRLKGRAEPPKPTPTATDAQSPERVEPVQDVDTWLMMDDLASERVKTVNINEALKKEWPYLLFYRVVPIGDSDTDSDGPPPYSESEESGSVRLDHKIKPADLATANRASLDLLADTSRRTSIVFSDASETTQPRNSISVAASITDHRSALSYLNSDNPSSRSPSIRPSTGHEVLPAVSIGGGTQPTTPGDDDAARKELDDASRTSSRSAKAPRSSTDGVGAGAGMRDYNSKFFAKVTSRLSRDRLNLPSKDAPEVVVREIPLASVDTTQQTTGTDEPVQRARQVSKERSKGMGFINLSRRGSLNDKATSTSAHAAAASGNGTGTGSGTGTSKPAKEKRRAGGRSRGKEPERDCLVM